MASAGEDGCDHTVSGSNRSERSSSTAAASLIGQHHRLHCVPAQLLQCRDPFITVDDHETVRRAFGSHYDDGRLREACELYLSIRAVKSFFESRAQTGRNESPFESLPK